MSTRTDPCALLRDDARWDDWLVHGLPGELEAHARECATCREAARELARLRDGLGALARDTARAAGAITPSSTATRVLAEIQAHEERPRRRAPWLLAGALAAAAVALWGRGGDSGGAAQARLDAPDAAVVITGDRRATVRGTDIALALPATVATEHRAGIRAGAREAELWPGSAVRIATGAMTLERGGVTLRADRPARVDATLDIDPNATPGRVLHITGQGRLAIERRSSEEEQMQILRRHKALAAATVAVVVIAGWATLRSSSDASSQQGATTIVGPGGAAVTADGEVRRFGAPTPELAAAAGTAGSSNGDAAHAALPASGSAFWNDDRQLISFTVPGEAIDADTGEPVTTFGVVAEATESAGYGQSKPRRWTFEERADGRFELADLGLGVWRLTVRAAGYAPLTQTLDLSRVDATPYVVAPLSRGAELTGQVVDWRGRPVSGAEVGLAECVTDAATKPASCAVVETGANGRFELPGVPEGEVFALRARHPRHGYATQSNLTRRAGMGEHVVIQLSGVVRISGEVTRGADRVPVQAAQVVGPSGARTQSDQNGYYEMLAPLEERPSAFVEAYPGGPSYKARIASYPDTRSAQPLTWVDAPTHVAETRIDFRLEMEHATLFGQITRAGGEPAAGVDLELRNSTGWAKQRGHQTFPTRVATGADGRYRIENVPAKAGYTMRFREPGSEEWVDLGYVNVPDETEVEASFQIPDTGLATVRGRFVGVTGEPVMLSGMGCQRVGALRRGAGGGVHHLPRCYDDGRFEFEALVPGTYTIENRVEWMDSAVVYRPQTITVAAGQVVDELKLVVEGEGAQQWRVRVLDRNNRILTGAFLRYQHTDVVFTSSLNFGADGTAPFAVNRKYSEVFFDCPGYESARVELTNRDPSEPIEIRLDRATSDDSD